MALPRLGLATKIFVALAAIVVVVLSITLVLTRRAAEGAAQTSLAKGLEAAQRGVTDQLTRQSDVLGGRLRAYAENITYRANIDNNDPQYLDYVVTAAEQTGALWVQVVGRDAVRRAKSDDPTASPDTLSGSPLIAGALDGDTKYA